MCFYPTNKFDVLYMHVKYMYAEETVVTICDLNLMAGKNSGRVSPGNLGSQWKNSAEFLPWCTKIEDHWIRKARRGNQEHKEGEGLGEQEMLGRNRACKRGCAAGARKP